MLYREFGSTGLRPSVLGLGTVKIGRNQGVKYPIGFELPTDAQVESLLDTAKSLGINLIDTAPAYGISEERLGKLLTQRSEWIICSKAGENFTNGQSSFDFSPNAVRSSVENSLRKLNTDYIDILLIHSDGNDLAVIEQGCLEELELLKREGKIRASGMSTKTIQGGLKALELSDSAMVTFNLNEQSEVKIIRKAQESKKGIFVKKAFASGHFSEAGITDPVQASLDLVMSEPGVTSVITGTINTDHLKENARKIVKACS